MDKLAILKKIMLERQYHPAEINQVLSRITTAWINTPETEEEIRTAFHCQYELWRGLGLAINKHLELNNQENLR